MLTSAIRGIYPCPYIYIYIPVFPWNRVWFLFSAENWKMISSSLNNLPFSISNAIGWSWECVWICLVQMVKQFIFSCICFKVVVHVWHWAFLVAHIFKYLVSNFVFWKTCMMPPALQFLYSWVWNLWLPTWSTTPRMLEQLPVYFYLRGILIIVQVKL